MSEVFDPRDLMDIPLDEFPETPLIPIGHYFAEGTTYELGNTTSEKQTPWIAFYFRLLEPGPDVLEDASKMQFLSTINLRDVEMPNRTIYGPRGASVFWRTPPAMQILRGFIRTCGNFSTTTAFAEAWPGTRVVAGISQDTPRNNPQGRPFNTVLTITGTVNVPGVTR